MEKTFRFYLILLVLLPSHILFSADSGAAELAKIKTQKNAIIPASFKKIDNVQKTKDFVQKKISCLIIGNCSSTDELMTSYALGFVMGASIPIKLIARLIRGHAIDNAAIGNIAQLLVELTLTGIVAYKSDKLQSISLGGIALHPYLSTISQLVKTAVLILGDTLGSVHEGIDVVFQKVSAEAKTPPVTFTDFLKIVGRNAPVITLNILRNLSKLVIMDAQCIWSESYCKKDPQDAAFGLTLPIQAMRRKALYFWLGCISGILTRKTLGFAIKRIPIPSYMQ